MKKCPSSIWCSDLKPQPSGHESTPVTITPGLPPLHTFLKIKPR